jgi:hypothetical protein
MWRSNLARRRSLSTAAALARGPLRVPLRYRVGDVLEGFRVTHVSDHPQFGITCYRFHHARLDTEWLHLDSNDTNNVFSVAFRTVPQDSTGVAHILEHTVLCGSHRYPVRDPFFNSTVGHELDVVLGVLFAYRTDLL